MLVRMVQSWFIVIVAMLYAVVFSPIIRRLDLMLKRTRALLLLFPDDVVSGVAAIKRLMQEFSRSRGNS